MCPAVSTTCAVARLPGGGGCCTSRVWNAQALGSHAAMDTRLRALWSRQNRSGATAVAFSRLLDRPWYRSHSLNSFLLSALWCARSVAARVEEAFGMSACCVPMRVQRVAWADLCDSASEPDDWQALFFLAACEHGLRLFRLPETCRLGRLYCGGDSRVPVQHQCT